MRTPWENPSISTSGVSGGGCRGRTRPRAGFHLWTTDSNGRRLRQKKEKTLGPASMPKHEAQSKLVEHIEEYTGRITKQGSAMYTFADLWNAYCAVRSGQ